VSGGGHKFRLGAWLAGILATVVSGVLVTWFTQGDSGSSGGTTQAAQDRPAGVVTTAGTTTGTPVDFHITDQLGETEISEQVTVVIANRTVGTLTVDVVHPTASLIVTVPRRGTYAYELVVATVMEDASGKPVRLAGSGRGRVDVVAGRSFALMGQVNSDGSVTMELR
jgi:hypothetical protein